MHPILILFFTAALVARQISLFVSLRNEKHLKARGGVEHGRPISFLLIIVYSLIFIGSVVETILRRTEPDLITIIALVVWAGSMLALVAVVRSLHPFWTFRVIIASNHQLNTKPLFRWIRHPNYFLNLLPEVAAVCLAGHAWISLAIGFPIYLILIGLRIRLEERVMKEKFAEY